ncbi:MAG: hypothetical protein KGZ25_04065 [Planctomycetes bacterium]|nr:hypothetical protein [Planctomycetota bacterium]
MVDRVQSAEPHTWTNNWLFPTDQDLKGVEDHYELELESGVQLILFWVGDLQLRDEERFWCRNYNEHEPARWLRFSGDPVEREIRAFAFIPQRTPSEPEVELKIVGEKVLFESQSVAVKI